MRRGGRISLYGPKLKSSSVVTFLVRFFAGFCSGLKRGGSQQFLLWFETDSWVRGLCFEPPSELL